MRPSQAFTELAGRVAHLTGRPATFTAGLALVVAWMMAGPLFGFSDSWQLVINTGTTIVTFLMVFLLQATQNRDSAALQAKLDELIRTSAAQNQFIGIERLSEEEVEEVRRLCEARARAAAVTAGAAQRRPESCAAETADRATG
ncbi:MAG TPA: low affinity iron permease family protein [Crenalkalicoccus sp.]|nr:low affinity iron permease family protein [Crenalkalicoccus sp.]